MKKKKKEKNIWIPSWHVPCQLQHRSSPTLSSMRSLHDTSWPSWRTERIRMCHIFHQEHRRSTETCTSFGEQIRTLSYAYIPGCAFTFTPTVPGRFWVWHHHCFWSTLRRAGTLSSEETYDRFRMFWLFYAACCWVGFNGSVCTAEWMGKKTKNMCQKNPFRNG